MRREDGLERVMEDEEKEKLVENVFQKYLGVSIRELNKDITRKLNGPVEDLLSEEETDLKKARRTFLKHYLIRLLERHRGNVKSASTEAGTSRRTLHRLIGETGVDTSLIRKKRESTPYETRVHDIIEGSLHKYEDIIHPRRLDSLYNHISEITKDIVGSTEDKTILPLKEAEEMFEAVFIRKSMARNRNNLTKTAREIGIRYETLHRKIAALRRKGLLKKS